MLPSQPLQVFIGRSFHLVLFVSKPDDIFDHLCPSPPPAASLLWSEDAGTGARAPSTPPNPSRSAAASRVGEA